MPHLLLQASDNPKELLKFVALEGVAGENARSLFGDWLIRCRRVTEEGMGDFYRTHNVLIFLNGNK